MHAAITCSASGARGAAAALPMSAASNKSGREARFAILRLQLVLEGEPGPQRRVRRTPTLLQAWTAVLLQERPLRSALRSRDLVLAQLLYNIPALLEVELARDRDAQILPKERLGRARTHLQSRTRLESKKVDVRSLDRSTRQADLCVLAFGR